MRYLKRKSLSLFIGLGLLLGYLVVGWLWFTLGGQRPISAVYNPGLRIFIDHVLPGTGAAEIQSYLDSADRSFPALWVAILLFGLMVFVVLRPHALGNSRFMEARCRRHTEVVDAIPDEYLNVAIALAAGMSLFAELMVVRLHSSYFQLFSYFKNASLLSCFLGLGIGYATSTKQILRTPMALPLFALQTVMLFLLRLTWVGSFLLNPVAEQFTMGSGIAKGALHAVLVDVFLLVVFAFNAIAFIPLGHLVARIMGRRDNLVAYSWNLLGSLFGIGLFSLLSYLWTPPWVWLLVTALLVVLFLVKDSGSIATAVGAVVAVATVLSVPFSLEEHDVYSPYQTLTLKLSQNKPPMIETGNIYYQRILDLRPDRVKQGSAEERWAEYYNLPYRFVPKPEDVLIVGAGSGNDVAAGLRSGAHHIDAVEIDPAIIEFGRRLHPEAPYQSSQVTAHVNDARAFFRSAAQGHYDLIVYGLLDSHTLLSGLSGGIRLDSYVYTVNGFREARRLLKPDGLICLTFSLMSPNLGRKLYLMLEEAFDGRTPVVYQVGYDGGYAFLISNEPRFAAVAPLVFLTNVTDKFAADQYQADKSTDDWPFFYMPVRKYPLTYVVIIAALFTVSLLFVRRFVPWRAGEFSAVCWFLGAGFMLVETKSITELALVFGSTWAVTGIVIASILVMAFLANLLVMRIGAPLPAKVYPWLLLALLAGFGWTFVDTSTANPWLVRLAAPAILTLPLFFSGLAFSAELGKSISIGSALSSNLLGAMIGGLLEYNSMYFGFRSLYLLAIVMYGVAFWAALRTRWAPA